MKLSKSDITLVLLALLSVSILFIGASLWEASGLQASATIILVGITAWYAIQTQRNIEEIKNDRKRPYVLDLITSGLDPMLREVKHNNQRIEQRENNKLSDYEIYPIISANKLPSEEMRRDLDKDGFRVGEDCQVYSNFILKYNTHYTHLRLDLRAHIQGVFSDWVDEKGETLPEKPQVAVGTSQNRPDWEDAPNFFADRLAEWVILGFAPNDWVHEVFGPFENDLMRLRKDEFEQEFNNLDRLLNDINDLGILLSKDLSSTRSSYLNQYDITEMELESVIDQDRNERIE